MSDELFNHTQAFQQAMATTITCRALIKYNSNLSPEQKAEILAEIETTLAFLGKSLEINASIEAGTALSPEKLADLLITEAGREDEDEEDEKVWAPTQPAPRIKEPEISLHQIYQLYQTYLSNKPGRGIASIESRYKTAMSLLDRLQELTSARSDTTASDVTADELFSRIRGFVTALYSMFREFASLFSKVVEGKNIETETDALAPLQSYQHEAAQQVIPDIAPLVSAYEKQRRMQERRGPLRESVRDATAFLIFLQENLEQTVARRQEMASQIKSLANLLHELTILLTDYEQAVARIMQAPSKSR
jgi:hypothetical protein